VEVEIVDDVAPSPAVAKVYTGIKLRMQLGLPRRACASRWPREAAIASSWRSTVWRTMSRAFVIPSSDPQSWLATV
jgi:hypothetical protein